MISSAKPTEQHGSGACRLLDKHARSSSNSGRLGRPRRGDRIRGKPVAASTPGRHAKAITMGPEVVDDVLVIERRASRGSRAAGADEITECDSGTNLLDAGGRAEGRNRKRRGYRRSERELPTDTQQHQFLGRISALGGEFRRGPTSASCAACHGRAPR